MLYTHKLNRLSSDEISVLLYCVNDGETENPKIDRESLSWVRPSYAFNMLNAYAQKLKDQKKIQQIQAIADKISNP